MSYVREIRRLIGNMPFIKVGAAVLMLDSQERLLLLHRVDNECWGLPGGALEPGETLEETARREVLEETELMIQSLLLYDVFSGSDLFYQYPNGDQVYNVTVVYLAKDWKGALSVDHQEHTAGQFYELNRLPSLLSSPDQPVISRFVKRSWESTNHREME